VRQSVKPGVTGWAQVRYHYGASVEDSAEKLQYDLYYVKNHTCFSIWSFCSWAWC
jgi:lipopolysaccharide/colanic/teichoic acid biosynthesis glycosyltransferase